VGNDLGDARRTRLVESRLSDEAGFESFGEGGAVEVFADEDEGVGAGVCLDGKLLRHPYGMVPAWVFGRVVSSGCRLP
jgi:hypothetical protein